MILVLPSSKNATTSLFFGLIVLNASINALFSLVPTPFTVIVVFEKTVFVKASPT